MTDIAIRVDNLSKRYRIGKAIEHTDGNKPILQKVTSPFRYLASTLRPPDEDEILWALKNVSFEVQRGEVVGIPSQARDRHRAQRGGQKHPAQDPLAHHRADLGTGDHQRAGGFAAGSLS